MEYLAALVGAAGTTAEPALRVFLVKEIPAATRLERHLAAVVELAALGQLPAHQVRADRQREWEPDWQTPLAARL
jgi:hypothetical protein